MFRKNTDTQLHRPVSTVRIAGTTCTGSTKVVDILNETKEELDFRDRVTDMLGTLKRYPFLMCSLCGSDVYLKNIHFSSYVYVSQCLNKYKYTYIL